VYFLRYEIFFVHVTLKLLANVHIAFLPEKLFFTFPFFLSVAS
jgi:hypothetical protein